MEDVDLGVDLTDMMVIVLRARSSDDALCLPAMNCCLALVRNEVTQAQRDAFLPLVTGALKKVCERSPVLTACAAARSSPLAALGRPGLASGCCCRQTKELAQDDTCMAGSHGTVRHSSCTGRAV